jgi:urease accessory protein
VCDAETAKRWIGGVLELSLARMEAPILLRLIDAWRREDVEAVRRWNDEFIASRETAELRAETLQMGHSMRNLIVDMEDCDSTAVQTLDEIAFPAAFAFAAARGGIDPREGLIAYLFSWVENQALAAMKAIPLGQTGGQRLLRDLAASLPAMVERAAMLSDEDLSNQAVGLALASSRHETQYSRLFRS